MSLTHKILSDPRLFVLYWCSVNSITVTKSQHLRDTLGRKPNDIKTSAYLDYKQLCRHFQFLPAFVKSEMNMAFMELIEKELRSIRNEKQIDKDPVDLFLEEHYTYPPFQNDDKPVLARYLYTQYQAWCARNRFKCQSVNWFGRYLTERGFQALPINNNWCRLVNGKSKFPAFKP